MAEMNMPEKGGRRKLQAPRIDLTPMVDLGFLLITFFMFTTTLAQPKAMDINMPFTDGSVTDRTPYPEEATLTLIPAAGHKLYYYEGAYKGAEAMKSVPVSQVNSIVAAKKARVAALPASYSANAHKLHVIIKASDDSRYDDLVRTLDAMLIANVGMYAIADITGGEQEAVRGK